MFWARFWRQTLRAGKVRYIRHAPFLRSLFRWKRGQSFYLRWLFDSTFSAPLRFLFSEVQRIFVWWIHATVRLNFITPKNFILCSGCIFSPGHFYGRSLSIIRVQNNLRATFFRITESFTTGFFQGMLRKNTASPAAVTRSQLLLLRRDPWWRRPDSFRSTWSVTTNASNTAHPWCIYDLCKTLRCRIRFSYVAFLIKSQTQSRFRAVLSPCSVSCTALKS